MFLNLPFFLVQVLLFIFCDFRFLACDRCFCLFVCFQDARIQVVGRIRSNYVLQIHRVTSGKVVHNFVIGGFSVTSRCGPSTSRRQNYMPLSRRDVDLPRRDVIF